MIHNPLGHSTRDRIHRYLHQAENVFSGHVARQKIFEAVALSELLAEDERDHLMVTVWRLATSLGFRDLKDHISQMSERFDPC